MFRFGKYISFFFVFNLMLIPALASNQRLVQKNIKNMDMLNNIKIESLLIPTSSEQILPTSSYLVDINGKFWNLVEPIQIKLRIFSKVSSMNLFVFTAHREQSYWTGLATQLNKNVDVYGLVNPALITQFNANAALLPLEIVEVSENNKNISKWKKIYDLTNLNSKYLTCVKKMNKGQNDLILNMKTFWNEDKIQGQYYGKLFLVLGAQ